jgi:SAM-dependent methyltransferase
MRPYTDYDAFAWLYNRYWSERLIEQIYWTIEKYLLDSLRPGSRILDVCCGNGHLAARMAQRGFSVTGIDGSPAMLRFARENAPRCEFLNLDARDFVLKGTFDAAVSTCDSLNHIMTHDELARAFASVYRALRPGGRFLFDLNTEEGYRKYWTGGSTGKAEADHAFVVRLRYDERRQQGTFAATLFRPGDQGWNRSDALLVQQYYPPHEVREMLCDTGFAQPRVFDVEKDLGIEGTGRVMFVTGRPE